MVAKKRTVEVDDKAEVAEVKTESVKEDEVVIPKEQGIPTSWQETTTKVETIPTDDDSKGVTSGKDRLILVLGSVFVFGILVGAATVSWLARGQKTISESVVVVTPTMTPTPSPTAALAPSIVVLNASGKSGLAGRLAGLLKAEGLTDVETGNSDEARKGNLVNLPEGLVLSDQLKLALEKTGFKDYELGVSTSGKIEVVIGK